MRLCTTPPHVACTACDYPSAKAQTRMYLVALPTVSTVQYSMVLDHTLCSEPAYCTSTYCGTHLFCPLCYIPLPFFLSLWDFRNIGPIHLTVSSSTVICTACCLYVRTTANNCCYLIRTTVRVHRTITVRNSCGTSEYLRYTNRYYLTIPSQF